MRIISNDIDYMPRAQRVGLTSSLGTLGSRMTFSCPTDPTDTAPPDLKLGDAVQLWDADAPSLTVFRGIITARKFTETAREFTAYDDCYYLNKSQICLQFPEQRTDRAIAQLWDYLGIRRINLPRMQGVIASVVYVKTPAEILRSLLEFEQDVSGVEYYAVHAGYGIIDIQPVGQYRTGITLQKLSAPVLSDSLDEVRNRIYYAIKDDSGISVSAEAADEASIARYGQIAEYIIDGAEPTYTSTIAEQRLARKRVPLQNGEITLPGDWRAEIGKIIAVEDAVTGLSGDYVIDAVSHDIYDGMHLMTLGLSQRGGAA